MQQRVTHINLSDFDPKKDDQGRYICLNCGKPTGAVRRSKYCSWDCSQDWLAKHSHQFMRAKLIKERGAKCEKCGQPHEKLIMDHIVPIALGGEEFDPANLQILCRPCDKIKTAGDIKQITKQRRIERLPAGQQQLA